MENKISIIRKNRSMTLNDLSKKTGISISTLNRYEKRNDITSIPTNNLNKISEALNITKSSLLGEDLSIKDIVTTADSKHFEDIINWEEYFNTLDDFNKTSSDIFEKENYLDDISNSLFGLTEDGINNLKMYIEYLKTNEKYYDRNLENNYTKFRNAINSTIDILIDKINNTLLKDKK